MDLVRLCPRCHSQRQLSESYCENIVDGRLCGWSLSDEPIITAGDLRPTQTTPARPLRRCRNGHELDPSDQFCLQCGSDAALDDAPPGPEPESAVEPSDETIIDGWRAMKRVLARNDPWERFIVQQSSSERRALLTLYHSGHEPDQAVYDTLRRMPHGKFPELLATGRFQERTYDVVELIACETLEEAGTFAAGNADTLKGIAQEIGQALAEFAEAGLRHRDIRPGAILVRGRSPPDLIVTNFGSARLSDFDLELAASLRVTRYSAPETIVGAVSAASDWWGLGMVLLEQATSGACFSGVNEKAFQIHVVTRGIEMPIDLDPTVRPLLCGLLARDPQKRWGWREVRSCLAGETVDVPAETELDAAAPEGSTISLGNMSYRRPETFALAAAEPQNWDEGRDLVLRGAVSTWLEGRSTEPQTVAQVRRLASDESLPEDFRHSLAIMALNPSLPLTFKGDIVTPAWLLQHPDEGYQIITGEVSRHLDRMGRELWLVRMRARADAVRERARLLEIELDEDRLRVALLASSRANLEMERATLRAIYPETDHAGLSSLSERSRISDEDLIILIAASTHQFIPLATLVDSALEQARQVGIQADGQTLQKLLVRPRREIYDEVDERVANFARCNVQRLDEWADSFRVERRIPLARAAVLLAFPKEAWQEPPKQQYVAKLLQHFEKRVSGSVQRGPLVRFVLGKTTPRIDLTELGTRHRPAEAILNHVISRTEVPIALDPDAISGNALLHGRLRRLVSHATTFRRDTGIDGRYLGFPFLLVRDSRLSSTKPRIAPVLLWPVVLDTQAGSRGTTLMFDREREDVRLNPALEGLLGIQVFAQWLTARDEVLERAVLRVGDVLDIFGALATPRGRSLVGLPGKDAKLAAGSREVVPCAALFNAEFTGQAVSEDLRQIGHMPPAGSALEAAIRLSADSPPGSNFPQTGEVDRFSIVKSDPSQDEAILKARNAPGILVEGPPGTGKSQTIVNMVADAIGRNETVLIVCQKQAALKVVQKRLEAEELGERLFAVVDVNRDRETIVRALRDQVPRVREAPPGRVASLKRNRQVCAARIETLEADIDRHHEGLHAIDPSIGSSYRDLIGELVGVEADGESIDVSALRFQFSDFERDKVSRIEEACTPLARLWLDSEYEDSPLSVLRPFLVDDSVRQVLFQDIADFVKAEKHRKHVLTATAPTFDLNDPGPYRDWINRYGPLFANMTELVRSGLLAWFDLFKPGPETNSVGTTILQGLEEANRRLSTLDVRLHDPTIFGRLAAMNSKELQQLLRAATRVATATSLFGRLNLHLWWQKRRVRLFLRDLGEEITDARVGAVRDALTLETLLRPARKAIDDAKLKLRLKVGPPSSLPALRREIGPLLTLLREVEDGVFAALACPRAADAENMARAENPNSYAELHRDFEDAIGRCEALQTSNVALARLERWFEPQWIEAYRVHMSSGEPVDAILSAIIAALRTIESYQRFRARAKDLDPDAIAVFATLRKQDSLLRAIAPEFLERSVRNIIRREALLAWKAKQEASRPALLIEQDELRRKIEALGIVDGRLRTLNKQLLCANIDAGTLGAQTAWDDITRLRGPRMKRLREIIAEGAHIGLMRLRPIWLMNPEVASRILPRQAGLFDLVVYDEASQMLVEHAIPTLFRARRVVISGDEKQMPPSNFFATRIDSDEDEEFDLDLLDDTITDAERAAREETWNRREIKDCPDLLQLGRGALPSTTLQVHYRSAYRELIIYSNAAFYRGKLSVPVRHPDDEVRHARPIEVIRVDGVYEDQTNETEAKAVVRVLAKIWSAPPEKRPTIGVVTFNRKQADLVEDAIEERTLADPKFLQAYQIESQRTRDGEDVGFFVKNVENVQGDERDVILFSTTFGRDKHGSFRRNFGVLGQSGGERRLNVAITRAREKVILVTSIPVNDVSDMLASGRSPSRPRDYLQAYLDYAVKMASGDLDLARRAIDRFGSARPGGSRNDQDYDGFVASVASFVEKLGYDPVPSNEGDAFGIDLAIKHPQTGLFGIGIECDAPRHELLNHARAREIWRPTVLSRAIPVVHRVASYAWYHRAAEERTRLSAAIETALRGG